MLDVKAVSKTFGDFKAVDTLSLSVKQGQVFGLLGANGAGKSTTMRVITGFLEATEGDVFVCGESITKNTLSAQQNLGYVPENAPLYDEMRVREFLEFMAAMRNLKEKASRIDAMLTMCALESVEFQKIETLSKGYKRRVSLAQGLVHDPKVLVLDEPTDGLDPNQKYDVRKLIKNWPGKSVS